MLRLNLDDFSVTWFGWIFFFEEYGGPFWCQGDAAEIFLNEDGFLKSRFFLEKSTHPGKHDVLILNVNVC